MQSLLAMEYASEGLQELSDLRKRLQDLNQLQHVAIVVADVLEGFVCQHVLGHPLLLVRVQRVLLPFVWKRAHQAALGLNNRYDPTDP